VTRDPELAAALETTRALLDPADTRSEAGQVRRLALVGAHALAVGSALGEVSTERRRLLVREGVRPATGDLDELPWLDGSPVDDERRGSRALEWVRGER